MRRAIHRGGQACLAVLTALLLALLAGACSDDTGTGPDSGVDGSVAPDSSPPDVSTIPTCAKGSRTGPKGNSSEKTARGYDFTVRTPDSYDPEKGHPLIVVYGAAGGTPAMMEQVTGLTPQAKSEGYIIAYVDGRYVNPQSRDVILDIAKVPQQIAAKWCVDTSRIYFTGHSNGGSEIYLFLAYDAWPYVPAAIAPSAAGVSSSFLNKVTCWKDPIPVMIMHSKNDTLFPGYGRQARDWWVKCNGCSATAGAALPDGCLPYPNCKDGVELLYCEGSGSHGTWPSNLNKSIFAFFKKFKKKQ
jgi:polyhydroxybutyrate depolymerase